MWEEWRFRGTCGRVMREVSNSGRERIVEQKAQRRKQLHTQGILAGAKVEKTPSHKEIPGKLEERGVLVKSSHVVNSILWIHQRFCEKRTE